MSTDDLDLAELRRIAEAATPGPWVTEDGGEIRGEYERNAIQRPWVADADFVTGDVDHIATFDPPTVLALLDRIESLEAERDGANQRAGTLARAHDKEKARAVAADEQEADHA